MRTLSSGELASFSVDPYILRTDFQLCHLSGQLVADICSCKPMPIRPHLEIDVPAWERKCAGLACDGLRKMQGSDGIRTTSFMILTDFHLR